MQLCKECVTSRVAAAAAAAPHEWNYTLLIGELPVPGNYHWTART